MGKGDAIRVTVRFRPMNKVESSEGGNHICVRISDCRRAVKIVHPDRPANPLMFYFDQIYPPGVSQLDVYSYTGKVLVEQTINGFNATIFAYGQTGSGKTFSMMGVLGTDLKGIIPRIIEDAFEYIENLPPDNKSEYTVQIIMCEIYLEKIKDLFNPVNANLKVREHPDLGIYLEDCIETYCATVQEVLDAMDAGFMNRATSATRMNAESSRSHCVVILKIVCRAPGGSKTEAKIKMVDLAGSEKTKKTAATGQRLLEAKMINQSLTALSQVLVSLTEGGFVPYRNSKLTRLLQDALGGNSKTSLICATSPCSYNVEETIGTLRFGTRAKKVKCKAKINEELSLDEYKSLVKKLKAKLGKAVYDIKLLTLQKAALEAWIQARGGDPADIIKDVKVVEEEEKDEDLSKVSMDFNNEVSSNLCVIDKRTGKVVGGQDFSTNINDTPDDLKSAERAKAAAMGDEQAKMELAQHLLQRGDMDALKALGMGGGISSEQAEEYEDKIADLGAELRGEESRADQLEEELEKVTDELDQTKEEMAKMNARLAEYRFYKQKVEFLEKENEMQLDKMKQEQELMGGGGGGGTMVDLNATASSIQLDQTLLSIDASNIDARTAGKMQEELQKMLKLLSVKDQQISNMREEGGAGGFLDTNQLRELAEGSGEAKQGALKKILATQQQMQGKLKQKQVDLEKMQRTVQMLQQRDKFNNELRKNWQTQLQQMEQAVLLCSQIHGRDRKRFAAELAEKEEQILKLKAYVQKMNEMRNRHNKSMYGSSNRIRMPIARKGAAGMSGGKRVRRRSFDAEK